jgi:hypothetical protein
MTSPSPELPSAVPAVPAAIEPDAKDWTWVLRERCPECGYTASDVDPGSIGATLRDLLPRWVGALHHLDARRRPEPSMWSALEYGAHVRDVHRVFGTPLGAAGHPPATAVADRYDLQDPTAVVRELAEESDRLAEAFDAVTAEQWDRPGRRSNGSAFTVRTLGLYFLHDVVHHLHDVNA